MWRMLAYVALVVSFSSVAFADGLPERRRELVYAPSASWTGCYLGGHLGGGWGRKAWSDDRADTSFIHSVITTCGRSSDLGSHDVAGFMGGIQGGCDYQFAGHLVLGVQGDFSWANLEGQHTKADAFNNAG